MTVALIRPEGFAVATRKPSDGKATPVRFRGSVYADLKAVAAVTGRDIMDVAEELIRAPLALLKSKLGPEIAQHEKMERAKAEMAVKARKKLTGESE